MLNIKGPSEQSSGVQVVVGSICASKSMRAVPYLRFRSNLIAWQRNLRHLAYPQVTFVSSES